jgi:two-component system, chemotaxis family, chemotaxis protein CheY
MWEGAGRRETSVPLPRCSSGRLNEELMKALVVDSSNTMRSVLRRILSMRGFEVEEADDGLKALDVLRRIGIADVVLVDWNLAPLDGLEFVTCLRRESSRDTLVIMMVAAEPGQREIQRALIAGANDYLLKPFNSLQIDKKLALAGLA